MITGTWGASLLGNLLTGKGTIRAGEEATVTGQARKSNILGQGMIKAGQCRIFNTASIFN